MILATSARPSPLPVGFVVTNGSNRLGNRSSGTPGPLSLTQNSSGSDTREGVVGLVSVGRSGRAFTAGERDLFHYLATQAGVSMENVGLHETVARESVTDELTGLFNRRRFDEVLDTEVERAKRFGQPMALVLLAFAWQMGGWRGLPNVLIVMFVLVVIYRFITNKTTIGRRIYALGGNIKAARLSGIRTERLTFLTFVNMGVLAGLGGLITTARLNSATPKAGVGFELDVIAACFIGGASASGGVGKITGAVIGAFIMGVMNNGMSILGIGIEYQQIIKGLVLLGAVVIDVYNQRR